MSEDAPRRGRPTKFTPERAATIIKTLQKGALLQDAADLANVSRETVFRWLREGEEQAEGEPLADFCNAVREARAQVKTDIVGFITERARVDWHAGAWWLGVTDPVNYGPKVRVTLEEEFTNGLKRIEKRLPPEVFEQVLAAIAEGDSEEDAPSPPPPKI